MSLIEIARKYPSPGWEKLFQWADPELTLLSRILDTMGTYFPDKTKVFRALDLCPPQKVKVLIMGQDPYHVPGQANGLAFSTDRGHGIQPSLKNIYAELEREYNIEETKALISHWNFQSEERLLQIERTRNLYSPEQISSLFASIPTREQIVELAVQERPIFQRPNHGDLTKWEQEGVLLLNASLTVAPHQAGSHKSIWNGFITKVLLTINEANPECVCLLWGKKAQEIGEKMGQRAIKICASHPSPHSADKATRDCPAFLGSNCFKQTNQYLVKQGKTPINWTIPLN